MTTEIYFEIPGLPKSPNALLGAHWRTRSAHAKKWHQYVKFAVMARPKIPWRKVRLELTRYSSVRMDRDGVFGSFKPVVDGLRYAGVIEDDHDKCVVEWKASWEKAPPKKGYISVRVVNLEMIDEKLGSRA